MNRYEFNTLKNKFATVDEAIRLYDTGHSEYSKNTLDTALDDVHKELCYAASEVAQKLIKAIDKNTYKPNSKYAKAQSEYLEALNDMAYNCYIYGVAPEDCDFNYSYGNGIIDAIGADFTVRENERTEYKYFDYSSFYELISDIYEII